MLNLKQKYQKEVIPQMKEKFGYKNDMAVPRIEKVVINTGFGKVITAKTGDERKKFLDAIVADLTLISGQKSMVKGAKKSISSFKLRKGMSIGVSVTLRQKMMFDFLGRLIHIVLPRSRDFRGIDPSSFDKSGNLTIAVKEHIAFPEILPEKTRNIFGLEITIVVTSKKREEGIELLRLTGFPVK